MRDFRYFYNDDEIFTICGVLRIVYTISMVEIILRFLRLRFTFLRGVCV